MSGEFRSHYESPSVAQGQAQDKDTAVEGKVGDNKQQQQGGIEQQKQQQEQQVTTAHPPPRPIISERTYGSFTRSFVLPRSIDTNGEVKASFKDGLLRVEVPKHPKPEHKPPRSIAISAE